MWGEFKLIETERIACLLLAQGIFHFEISMKVWTVNFAPDTDFAYSCIQEDSISGDRNNKKLAIVQRGDAQLDCCYKKGCSNTRMTDLTSEIYVCVCVKVKLLIVCSASNALIHREANNFKYLVQEIRLSFVKNNIFLGIDLKYILSRFIHFWEIVVLKSSSICTLVCSTKLMCTIQSRFDKVSSGCKFDLLRQNWMCLVCKGFFGGPSSPNIFWSTFL